MSVSIFLLLYFHKDSEKKKKNIFFPTQTHKQTDMLLDLDTTSGSGTFLAELEEPEHCNAGSTALWELHSLVRHYHPVVGKFARHILLKSPTTGNGALSMELTRKYVVLLT
jgi:nucleolar complex protein 3